MKLNHALIEYVKNFAKAEYKSKIIIDVHKNLRIFDKYYRPLGFTATERRCIDNGYWVEAELYIDNL